MTADRAEWTGIGAALAFHIALIAALSMSLAHVVQPPEPPAMEVELVDDVALAPAAPTPASPAPPPPSAESQPAQELPIQPPPQAILLPTPTPALAQRAIPRPVPQQVQQPQPARPAPPASAPARPIKRPGLDQNFLKSFDDDLAPHAGAAAPSAPKFDAKAQASVAALIARQIEPCARRQRHVADTAKSMSVVLSLAFLPSGQLRGRPAVVRVDGVTDENSQFRDLAVDQAIAAYQQCAPLRLPAELYSTAQGGWKNIRIIFDVR